MEPRLLFLGAPSVQLQVASDFVNLYYKTLRQHPELLLNTFYRVSSIITRAEAGSDGTEMSIYDLDQKLKATDHGGFQMDILAVDSQGSLMGGILVNVTGSISRGYQKRRNFVQTFFLVPQEVGYFVKNDIFRYLDREVDSETMSLEPVAQHDSGGSESGSSWSPQTDQEVHVMPVVDETYKSVGNATSTPWVKVVVEEILGTEQEVSPLIPAPEVEAGADETVTLVGSEQEAWQELVPGSTPEMELAAEETVRSVEGEKKKGTAFPTEVEKQEGTTISKSELEAVVEVLEAEDDNIQKSGTLLETTVTNDEQLFPLLAPGPQAKQTLEEVPKRFVDQTLSYASVLRANEVARHTFSSTSSAPRRVHSHSSHSYLPRVSTTSQLVLEKLNKIASSAVDERTVYIKNLPVSTSASDLEVELRRVGPINAGGVTLKGQNDGVRYAFVKFKDSASAKAAIESSPISFGGRTVYICKKRSVSRTEGVRAGHGPGRRGQ